jgi:hypothetical protein
MQRGMNGDEEEDGLLLARGKIKDVGLQGIVAIIIISGPSPSPPIPCIRMPPVDKEYTVSHPS